MSGGGSHGAYEAGAIQGLVSSLQLSEVSYDVVSGISAGSINSLGFSQFPKGQEVEAANYLNRLWLSINGSETIMKNWPGGVIQGITLESGLYDTTPLRNFLTANVVKNLTRTTIIGVTNLNTGKYNTFTNRNSIPDWITTTMASSAIEGVFPTVKYQNDVFGDGGAVLSMDVMVGVEACLNSGSAESDVVVDMISCSSKTINNDASEMKTLDVYNRARDIKDYYGTLKHIAWAVNAYPLVEYRYYLQPSEPLPSNGFLDLSKAAIEGTLAIGLKDATYVVNNDIFMDDVLPSLANDDGIVYIA
jgi:predicted patatin/cPLA2 family phospholipase